MSLTGKNQTERGMDMVKLILADDEPVILRGIKKLVDWEKLGISIVGEYEEGISAMEGILSLKPEIALLDINMPGMDGIEILKNIRRLELTTKVIFISGFQDFEYARNAITYGAVEYLLKPVILEELIHAIGKAVQILSGGEVSEFRENKERVLEESETFSGVQAGTLEETTYLPVLADILFDGSEDPQVKRLLYFSFQSFLEEYLSEKDLGILFTKNNDIVMVFKGMNVEVVREELYALWERTSKIMEKKTAFIIGCLADSMSRIPREYDRCLEMKRYLFFVEQIYMPILCVGEPVFLRKTGTKEISQVRDQMIEGVFAQDEESFFKAFERFSRVLCIASDGRREDACYYFCSSVRRMEEKMHAMNLKGREPDMGELLKQGRSCQNYEQMKVFFREYLEGYLSLLRDMMESSEKKDIVYAKAYIEEHYKENLSLEVLAGIVHMNPYYFSSFFKKQAGENFKDYVNKVRISHAVPLLLSTDMKAYEIAMETGFRDARAFTEVFSRIYGETPSSYKKRVLDKDKG